MLLTVHVTVQTHSPPAQVAQASSLADIADRTCTGAPEAPGRERARKLRARA